MQARRPPYRKLPGPKLKTYPIEGMTAGAKYGAWIGGALGFAVYVLLFTPYKEVFPHSRRRRVFFPQIAFLFTVAGSALGVLLGALLGALVDKLRGRWE